MGPIAQAHPKVSGGTPEPALGAAEGFRNRRPRRIVRFSGFRKRVRVCARISYLETLGEPRSPIDKELSGLSGSSGLPRIPWSWKGLESLGGEFDQFLWGLVPTPCKGSYPPCKGCNGGKVPKDFLSIFTQRYYLGWSFSGTQILEKSPTLSCKPVPDEARKVRVPNEPK